jgi:hypothetical protein
MLITLNKRRKIATLSFDNENELRETIKNLIAVEKAGKLNYMMLPEGLDPKHIEKAKKVVLANREKNKI